jgi:hypothetical protein
VVRARKFACETLFSLTVTVSLYLLLLNTRGTMSLCKCVLHAVRTRSLRVRGRSARGCVRRRARVTVLCAYLNLLSLSVCIVY